MPDLLPCRRKTHHSAAVGILDYRNCLDWSAVLDRTTTMCTECCCMTGFQLSSCETTALRVHCSFIGYQYAGKSSTNSTPLCILCTTESGIFGRNTQLASCRSTKPDYGLHCEQKIHISRVKTKMIMRSRMQVLLPGTNFCSTSVLNITLSV